MDSQPPRESANARYSIEEDREVDEEDLVGAGYSDEDDENEDYIIY
jgi:hypothetical protein